MSAYVIKSNDGNFYVCMKNCHYTLTSDKNQASVFGDQYSAERLLKNSLSKKIKKVGVAVKILDEQDTVPDDYDEKENIESVENLLCTLSSVAAKLKCRGHVLQEQLSKHDLQVTDVEHYIEFNAGKLNAYEGYKAYKLLQDILVERRKIKKELHILKDFKGQVTVPRDIDAKINKIKSQTYKPRELKYLFDKKEN